MVHGFLCCVLLPVFLKWFVGSVYRFLWFVVLLCFCFSSFYGFLRA